VLPLAITTAPLRTVRPRDLDDVYTEPKVQLRRWVREGRMNRLAHGAYYALPDDAEAPWFPTLEAAAAAAATAFFGDRVPVLMHLTAARLHGVIPRALGVAIVAVPRQHKRLKLLDRPDGEVLFVKRDVEVLDAVLTDTDLGEALMTTLEQTALDLAKRPTLGDLPDQTREALAALLPRCDRDRLVELAQAQRAQAALAVIARLDGDRGSAH
jgi:hypothetical protein